MARDVTQIKAGAGALYVAPIDTPEPTSASDSLNPAFRSVGYTKDGSTVKMTTDFYVVEIPSEYEPSRYVPVKRVISIAFAMAQTSIDNLALAFNSSADYSPAAQLFQPPAPGADVRVKFVLITDDGELWLFRRCINDSQVSNQFAKAPDYRSFPVEYKLEDAGASAIFEVFSPAITTGGGSDDGAGGTGGVFTPTFEATF